MKHARTLCALAAVFAVLVGVPWAASATVYVDQTAPGPNDGTSWSRAFTTLQPAIDAAWAAGGDQVWVAGVPPAWSLGACGNFGCPARTGFMAGASPPWERQSPEWHVFKEATRESGVPRGGTVLRPLECGSLLPPSLPQARLRRSGPENSP